jgi:hypothetical protein
MVVYWLTLKVRHDLRWRGMCAAQHVTAQIVVCGDWFGSVLIFSNY